VRALFDVPAPAKLNLFLHVVGRRADGHHLLQSVFVLIDWADTLHFERRSDARLTRHDVTAALPPDDLCLRAARALQSASGTHFGVDISIDKRVPWGAGLGGGSSDAASTLLALNTLWGLHWPRQRLHTLALALGADVPFFVGGHNAWVEGTGEQLTPFTVPAQSFVLVKPSVSIETRTVFAHPMLVRDRRPVILSGFDAGQLERIAAPPQTSDHATHSASDTLTASWGHNDLQAVAELLHPEVKEAAQCLAARYGNSRMSGSGSVVFSRTGSIKPVASVPKIEVAPRWVEHHVRSLPEHPLRQWAAD
jgi:4-diphosphocytidyl-2-C-methyl-D-erythritol kinase